MIVIASPTIRSGAVVRFYRDTGSAENGGPHVSASRDEVLVHGTAIADVWLDDAIAAARRAHSDLAAGDDVRHLATHRRGSLSRTLEEIDG